MTRVRRKRMHCNNKELHNRYKTKRRTKDLDQIQEDLKPENKARLLSMPEDEDLPGLGQHYCIECSKYFVDDPTLAEHRRGREHKRRLRDLKVPAYTQKEAEAAAGLTTDNGKALSSSVACGPSSLLALKQKNEDVAAAKAAAKEKSMDVEL
ncbi:hypothetical protein GQ54DRAFT_295978 [Martensiomyces pterosporus]|nr:hypothetical protein GQ54DRAFT_295978 [Martensiomyces pterosporus]